VWCSGRKKGVSQNRLRVKNPVGAVAGQGKPCYYEFKAGAHSEQTDYVSAFLFLTRQNSSPRRIDASKSSPRGDGLFI
jgi:hypothetical protein